MQEIFKKRGLILSQKSYLNTDSKLLLLYQDRHFQQHAHPPKDTSIRAYIV